MSTINDVNVYSCEEKEQLDAMVDVNGNKHEVNDIGKSFTTADHVYANSVTANVISNNDIIKYCNVAQLSDKYELMRTLIKDPDILFIINDLRR